VTVGIMSVTVAREARHCQNCVISLHNYTVDMCVYFRSMR